MNFENLISKYLDSELTPDEDSILRDLLTNDPAKKREFNEFVELHYILKNDAQYEYLDEEDFSDVEDNFLMHILVSQNTEPKRTYAVNYKEFLTPVMATFLVFFISIYNIFDVKFFDSQKPLTYNLTIPKENLSAINVETISFANFSKKVSNSNQVNTTKNQIPNTINSKVNNLELVNSKLDNLENSDEINITTSSNNEIVEVQSNNIEKLISNENKNQLETKRILNSNTQSTSSQYISNEVSLLQMNYIQENLNIKNLVFESNILSDVGRTGFTPVDSKKINTYTQSVAIKVNDKFRIGLELGTSNYDFMTKKEVTIPYNQIGNYPNNILNGRRLPGGILTTIDSKINYNNYFASVFADSKLYENQYFSINGRTGLGVSNGGLLITGRLYADIRLFGAFHLITGIDGRTFQNDNEFYNQNGIFNANVSYVNGLYFNF